MNEMLIMQLKKYFESKDDEALIEYLKKNTTIKQDQFLIIVLSIKDSELREKIFNKYTLMYYRFDLQTIKKLFTPEALRVVALEFLDKMKPTYFPLKSMFIVAAQDKEQILKTFEEAETLEDRMELIKNVYHCYGSESEIEQYLISKIQDKDVKYLLNTNNKANKNLYTNENDDMVTSTVSPEITIGVELEVINPDIKRFINIPSLFETFEITKDNSVKKGFEVISPILHYTKEDLTTLEAVCATLEKMNFSADQSCGCHVHIGADYLKTKEDYATLLYLFANCEDIIYNITDKAYSQKRLKFAKFAGKVKKELINSIENGDLEKCRTYSNYIETIKKISSSRYRGLNLQNINKPEKNTIEFRMANGEVSFKEILANINLFAKLVQISHDLNTYDEYNFKTILAKKIGNEPDEEKRLELLLNLLFETDKEKEIYRLRYFCNTKLDKIIEGEKKDSDNVLIDIDSTRKLTSKTI